MLIWSGWGGLVFLIIFLNSFITEKIVENITKNEYFYQENPIPLIFSIYISSIIIYFLGKWLNKNKVKTYIEKDTGNEVISQHTFFFIKMEYWSFIIFVIAMFKLIKYYFF